MSPGSLCVADDPLSCSNVNMCMCNIMYVFVVTVSRNGIDREVRKRSRFTSGLGALGNKMSALSS